MFQTSALPTDLPWDEGDLSQLEAFANRLPPWLPPTAESRDQDAQAPGIGHNSAGDKPALAATYQECRAAKTLE